jgi:HSP20 family molecular chaperone IbpA
MRRVVDLSQGPASRPSLECSYERSIAIGPAIAGSAIKATYRRGTLTVVLPKSAADKPAARRIPIR